MTTDPDTLRNDWTKRIAEAADAPALEALRVAALGKSGEVTALLKTMGSLSPDERQERGPKIHALREAVSAALAAKKDELDNIELDRRLATERVDLSLPSAESPTGSIHPVSQVMDELAEIFADLGFAVAEGPEIEDDWHNFTALNIPETHPARAMHDTFYVGEGDEQRVLRTHTSPVQIRTMMSQQPPIRIIAPGRVYRSDSDATHTPMFHQIEGLVIDRGIHMGHLKWTLETFLKAFFERDDIVLRLRPSYFPFTEPSAEMDLQCFHCHGASAEPGGEPCRVCSSEGWIEWGGCGMVNPAVLRACGIDPDRYSGFAFGMGLDRTLMFRHGITDIRDFYEGDQRFSLALGQEA